MGFVQLDDSLFVEIEIGQSVVVDDPDGAFTVTAFDEIGRASCRERV